jgi:hypothetical protein
VFPGLAERDVGPLLHDEAEAPFAGGEVGQTDGFELLSDLSKGCIYYFGQARQKDGSHHVYKTPWQGDPRINIQNYKGKAKAYQVKQVLLAIEKLEVEHAAEK